MGQLLPRAVLLSASLPPLACLKPSLALWDMMGLLETTVRSVSCPCPKDLFLLRAETLFQSGGRWGTSGGSYCITHTHTHTQKEAF